MKKISLVVFLKAISSIFSSGQTPTQTPKPIENNDIIKISTNLIQIDVTVTDKNGKIVTDLKHEDFEVLKNDKTRKITNFSFVNSE